MSQWQKNGRETHEDLGAASGWRDDADGRRQVSGARGVRHYDRWTREEVRLLGRLSDAELADILGRSVYSIQLQRRRFGIVGPDRPIRRWTAEEEELLGLLHDDEVAGLIDRSVLAVRIRRRELGIPAPWLGGARSWSGQEIEILLSYPAKVAARKTGRSVGAIKSKRFKLKHFRPSDDHAVAARSFA